MAKQEVGQRGALQECAEALEYSRHSDICDINGCINHNHPCGPCSSIPVVVGVKSRE
jgi:hypothetical protein